MIKILPRLLLCWILATLPIPSYAATGVPNDLHWEFRWFGGGGQYSQIVPDNFTSGRIYAVSDIGSPFVTDDRGNNWTWLSYDSLSGYGLTVGAALLQSKVNPLLMFTIGKGRTLKSIDGGRKWKAVSTVYGANRPSNGRVLAFDPTNETKVYIAASNGVVARSTDTGETFSNYFIPFEAIVSNESAELGGSGNTRTGLLNNVVNIVRGSVTFTSSGETFTDSTTGTSGVLTGSAGGTGTLNYGNGQYTLKFFSTPTTTTATYTIRRSPNWLYVNQTGTKIFYGAKSLGLRVYDIASSTISTITLAPTTVSSYAVYKNNVTDYGTFVDGSGIENLCVPAGIPIACTATDGATWYYTGNATSPATNINNGFYMKRIAVKRLSNGQIRFVGIFLLDNLDSASGSFLRSSSDGGLTWATATLSRNTTDSPIFVGSGNTVPDSLREDPFDENVFYYATNFTIYRSGNGGLSFVEKIKGAGQTVNHDVKIAPDGTVIGCAMDIGCQKSTEHGIPGSWKNIIPKTPFSEAGVQYPGGHFWQFEILGDETAWRNNQGRIIILSNYWYDMIPRTHRCTQNGDVCTTSYLLDLNGNPIKIGLYGDVIWDRGYIRAISKSKDESILYAATDGENCKVNPSLPSDNCSSSGTNHVTGGLFMSNDDGLTFRQVWASPRRIYNALDVDPTDVTGKTFLFGTFAYNLYRAIDGGVNKNPAFVAATDYTFDTVYDSKGRPYAGGANAGAVLYKSGTTVYGNQKGEWGTWNLMKRFYPTNITSQIVDGLSIDPRSDDRLVAATVNATSTAGSLNGNRIWLTPNASKNTKADWYDITGDLPAITGCNATAWDYSFGPQGYLWCAASNGLFALNLADTPDIEPGVTEIGTE